MIEMAKNSGQHDARYRRLIDIGWWNQARIRQARVLVAGAGALGNEVIKQFALMGIGHLLIADFDTVEVHNLTRSVLFRASDEGAFKAERAAARARELNPDVGVETLIGDVVWDLGLSRLMSYDVVVGCLDSREARLGLNRNCWKASVPWIDGALGVASGQVRIFVPQDSPCYECRLIPADYQNLKLRYSCQLMAQAEAASGGTPTTAISASIVAAMQVNEAVKLLLGQPVKAGYEIGYDGRNYLYRLTKLRRREDCFSHDPIPKRHLVSLPEGRAATMTGRQLLRKVRRDLGKEAYVELDREVILRMVCPRGHSTDRLIRPRHSTGPADLACPECGLERLVELTHRLDHEEILDFPLSRLGVPEGHVLVGQWAGKRRFYALSGDHSTTFQGGD